VGAGTEGTEPVVDAGVDRVAGLERRRVGQAVDDTVVAVFRELRLLGDVSGDDRLDRTVAFRSRILSVYLHELPTLPKFM